ncbi:MAG: dienelactone hydrolase family protein [Calditrichaceae bacterium]
MKKLLFLLMVFSIPALAQENLVSERVLYKHGDTSLRGHMVFDKTIEGKRPAVLVIHEWWGLNEYARRRADQMAELGYVAFALDMYGAGVWLKSASEASVWAGKFYEDRQLMRDRAKAGLKILLEHKLTDTSRVAVIGYCFGGSVALELARSGADISGVVSFHGGLSTPNPEDANNIRCPILVLHGGDDPNVPPAEVEAFQKEMRDAGVDWQMNIYGEAVHAFTNPAAGDDNSKGAAYNEKADKRSWQAMKDFFVEIFGTGDGLKVN